MGGESISPSLARASNASPCASARKPDAVLWPKPRDPKWTPTQTWPRSSANRFTKWLPEPTVPSCAAAFPYSLRCGSNGAR